MNGQEAPLLRANLAFRAVAAARGPAPGRDDLPAARASGSASLISALTGTRPPRERGLDGTLPEARLSLALLSEHRRVWKREARAGSRSIAPGSMPSWTRCRPAGGPWRWGPGPGFFRERAAGASARHRGSPASTCSPLPGTTSWAMPCACPFGRRPSTRSWAPTSLHHLARPAAFFAEGRARPASGRAPGLHRALGEPLLLPDLPLAPPGRLHPRPRPLAPLRRGAATSTRSTETPRWSRGLVRRTPAERWRELGLGPPRARLLNGFAYLLSLGFKPGSLLPAAPSPPRSWPWTASSPGRRPSWPCGRSWCGRRGEWRQCRPDPTTGDSQVRPFLRSAGRPQEWPDYLSGRKSSPTLDDVPDPDLHVLDLAAGDRPAGRSGCASP